MNPTVPVGRSQLRIMKLIWFALLASSFIYYFMLTLGIGFPQPDPALPSPPPSVFDFSLPLGLPATIMGFAMMAAGVFLPALLLRPRKWHEGESDSPLDALPRFFPSFVIRLVLFEACATFGFVLAKSSAAPVKMLPFLLATVVGFLLNFPSERRMATVVQGRRY